MSKKIVSPHNLSEILERLQNYKSILSNEYGVISIAVFGSYVKNKQRARSDIDLFVELKEDYKTFDNYMNLKFFLEKKLRRKVDVGIKESIRKELKTKILSEAIYV
ncbi:MAG: nucleotidyltransferase family protein [Spirochaetes bacterium]|nr:nucleotidyltransferase family protein [Spirochaetota bacterium]